MFELVSVHVPKCGGTTLKNTLANWYGPSLWLKYPAPERPIRRRLEIEANNFVRWLRSPRIRAIHGHFRASRFAGERLITFLRDPVEIRVSAWHYIRREYENIGAIYNDDWVSALENELPDYLAKPFPTVTAYIDIPLERFAFIGFMDTFNSDMERLCKLLGIQYLADRANSNPNGSTYKIPSEWREEYARSNMPEVKLYEMARERRS